jgi:hypothetical protein
MCEKRIAPFFITLLLISGLTGLVGCSSAEGDGAADTSSAERDGDRRSLTIEDAKLDTEDNRLTVKGKAPRDASRIQVRILDQNGVAVASASVREDDGEWRYRERPAPSPACVAEASWNGRTVTREVEHRPELCDSPQPPQPAAQCADGVDNDGDGLVDFPADPGCVDANDDNELNVLPPPVGETSINSTSQNGTPASPVAEQAFVNQAAYRIFASNDLGMHCGDLDTRISSILPPFNTVHSQVIRRAGEPDILSPADGIEVTYSAASNPSDPILSGINSAGSGPVASSMLGDGSVYKTNFWNISQQAYDAFYPPGVLSGAFPTDVDLGLPMPDVERLYLGDGALDAEQQEMPGRNGPYALNTPLAFRYFVTDQPFFTNPAFQFGYVKEGVNWFEAAGIPLTAYDDFGRENPWPLMRVQARSATSGEILASVDSVLPISGEANCGGCHNAPIDIPSGNGTGIATAGMAEGTVVTSLDDPALDQVPMDVSREWAADVNILRLHDQKHGTSLETATDPATGQAANPIVCQSCHYTPALDLAQVGPNEVNGRDQLKHKSMSNVMHKHHGTVDVNGNEPGDADYDPNNLMFPSMPPAVNADGSLRDPLAARDLLNETCYQCHPGRRTDCLRGAMANGGMLCQDCHGDMQQVGDDFSRTVSLSSVGTFELAGDFYTNPDTPRVPWANEPGCGSCHTGDALDNMHGDGDTLGDPEDGIRLMQAYRIGDAKATPIVPSNKRFAENVVTSGPAAGNPMLYRVSTGHEGVFCEACHGATHGIWPNKNPQANDNVAALQLQGHTGTIAECSVCHTGDLGNNLDGPHGMHPIGEAGQRFANGGHEDIAERNANACRACHGRNGEGTVLSAMKTDRVLECDERTAFCPDGNRVLFPQGHQVGCVECHDNEL